MKELSISCRNADCTLRLRSIKGVRHASRGISRSFRAVTLSTAFWVGIGLGCGWWVCSLPRREIQNRTHGNRRYQQTHRNYRTSLHLYLEAAATENSYYRKSF